jgi:soluble lytic murein transglycosylase-like protein
MKNPNNFKILILFICLVVSGCFIWVLHLKTLPTEVKFIYDMGKNPDSPYCLQLYHLIEKYSDEYNIPKHIAYNVAYKETRYMGPFHWKYNPKQSSNAGAIGPMQIMPRTASWIEKRNIPTNDLMNNLELNVKISMKLLSNLHKKYNNWGIACGYYNTGYPIVNEYASFCISNKNYRSNWISI